jgi:mercuric ion binding protein
MNFMNKFTAVAVFIAFLFCINSSQANAEERKSESKNLKTETFTVYGVCGMCKAIIEDASRSVEGVASQDWNMETHMLTVSYNETKTNLDAIKAKIVARGYDTDDMKASDESRAALSPCCQYDRSGKNNDPMMGMPTGNTAPAGTVITTEHK